MRSVQSPFVSMALFRLHRGVTMCCWVAGGALIAQVLVWCIATFTEVRLETSATKPEAGAILTRTDAPLSAPPAPHVVSAKKGSTPADAKVVVSAQKPGKDNQRLSRFDPILATMSSLTLAAGTLSILILLPLLTMGALLGVSSATSGVDDAISAFMWFSLVCVLALPFGTAVGLPWEGGALTSYEMMIREVERAVGGDTPSWGGPAFYARFAMMPLACVACIVIVGLRFTSGVRSGMYTNNDNRLDPALEKETAGIRPGSLHAGRSGHAMQKAMAEVGSHVESQQPSVPRRLI